MESNRGWRRSAGVEDSRRGESPLKPPSWPISRNEQFSWDLSRSPTEGNQFTRDPALSLDVLENVRPSESLASTNGR